MSIEEEQNMYYDAAYVAGIDATICAIITILSVVMTVIFIESPFFGFGVSVSVGMLGASFYFYLKEALNRLRSCQLFSQHQKNLGSDEEEHF